MLLMQSQPTLTNDASNGILHELNNLSNFSHSSTESALELKLLMIDKVEAPSSQFWDFKALQVVGKLNQPDFQYLNF